MESELVLASSPVEAGISCWDLRSGAEHTRFRSCSTSPHGLATVAGRFIAAAQVPDSKSSSSSILYWSWNKPQPEVKSFPAEAINAIVSDGIYIVGGGVSGEIYLWDIATGRLLKKWFAHYRAVTCLVFSDDRSLLVSGSEDGWIRVWSLFMIFDDERRKQATHLYEYSFQHSSKVTDIKIGCGGSNAVIVSSSEDRTCKVWSMSGELLRDVDCPSVINAVVLDPGDRVFYAGGRDGKIYIVALSSQTKPSNEYIIGSFSEQRAFLYSHTTSDGSDDDVCESVQTMHKQIKELEQQGSSAALKRDLETAQLELETAKQIIKKWKKKYDDLHQFCVSEVLGGNEPESANGHHLR